MYRILRTVFFAALAVVLASPLLSGCSAPCTYPDQREVKIRVLNAMPDEEIITVFLNGKLLVKDFPYDPPATFGYFTTYDNGAPLEAGSSMKVTITSDAAGKNVIFKDSVNIDFHAQTLYIIGKGHNILPTDANTMKVLRLADDIQMRDPTKTFMRFVHAIPDLPSLDVFWSATPNGSPNATIRYGEENAYFDLTTASFLKITEAGKPDNIIFSTPHSYSFNDLVATTVVRGESKQYGTERTVSTLILSDANIGNFIFPLQTFDIRFVNATRSLKLSLLIRGAQDKLPRFDYSGQSSVINIGPDSIGKTYMPLNPAASFNGNSFFWFSTSTIFELQPTDTSAGFQFPILANRWYSIIAVQTNPLGGDDNARDNLVLLDTMTVQPEKGRLRIVDLSPDHPTISFALNGKNVTMTKKQVEFFDVPSGNQTITLTDVSNTKVVTFNVPIDTAISLYLMPATVTDSFPTKTSDD